MFSNIIKWLVFIRVATLLISLTSIVIANAVVIHKIGHIEGFTFFLSALLILALQILSNLANDLGDYLKGTDQSPTCLNSIRMLPKGEMSIGAAKKGIYIVIVVIILIGGILLYQNYQKMGLYSMLSLFTLGFSAIIAAIKYTLGKHPYGYKGYGDLSVFLFFGPIGIMGLFYLQAGFDFEPLFPALATGLLAVSVLNVNNIRDIDNDQRSHKITLAVRLGHKGARQYHLLINLCAFTLYLAYLWIYIRSPLSLCLLVGFLPYIPLLRDIYQKKSSDIPPYLGKTVRMNFFLALFFSIFLWGL